MEQFEVELSDKNLKRQEFVDDSIRWLLQEILPNFKEEESYGETVARIRNLVMDAHCKTPQEELDFYPFIESK